MAKPLKIVSGILVMLLLVAGGILLLADPNQFRGTIQSQLEGALNRKVTLGNMALRIYPLSIRIEQVSIAHLPGVPASNAFLTAKEILVRVNLMALLKKQVQVQSLHVIDPVVELFKLPGGSWNLSAGDSGAAPSSGANPDLQLAELKLVNGVIGITDLAEKKARQQYSGIDLDLRNFAFSKPFQARLTVHLPQNVKLNTSLDAAYDQAAGLLQLARLEAKLGGLTLSGSGAVHTASTPARLDLKINTANSSITELAKVAATFGTAFTPDMNVRGTLDAELAVQGSTSEPALNGRIGLKQVVVNRKGWQQPVRIPAMQIRLKPDAVRTEPFSVESGKTRIYASAVISKYNTPEATLLATLSASGANLGELLNVAMAYGVNALDGAAANGTVSIDMRLTGKLKGSTPWDYSGKGSLRDGSLTVAAFKRPIQIASADVKFEEDRAVIENLACSLGSSHLKGSLSVRNFTAPDLRFTGDLDQLNVVELQQLAADSAAGAGATARTAKKEPPKVTGQGKLSIGKLVYDAFVLNQVKSDVSIDRGVIHLDPLTAELFGGQQTGAITVDTRQEPVSYSIRTRMQQVDANQLLSATTPLRQILFGRLGVDADLHLAPKPGELFSKSMNGKLQMRLTDGKLSGVSVMNEMARIASLMGYRRHPEVVTNILRLSGGMNLDHGIASLENLLMEFDGGTLGGSGTVNLVDQSLSMKVTTVLSKAVSDQFAGNKIGGLLTSALQNAKGEIVIPSLVSGTAPKPIFTPDAQQLARMRTEGLLPTLKDPAAMAGGVGSAVEAGRKGGVQGVLDAISGRKKQEPVAQPASPAPEAGATPHGGAPAQAETQPQDSPQGPPAKKKGIGESLLEMLRKKQ
jgi:uncharacterized protein involved in outer membrane biogenesis